MTSTIDPHELAHPTGLHLAHFSVADAQLTPEKAKQCGLSAPRLLVYGLIHAAGQTGVSFKVIRDKSKLPHGSVQQVLHWLRKQELIRPRVALLHGDALRAGTSYILREIDPELWKVVKSRAALEGVSVKALIERLLREWVGRA